MFLLSACGSYSNKRATIDKQQRYILSDNYANHRIQQSRFVSSGGEIAYLDYGDGPALVLLHGVPTSSWLYRKMVPDLQNHFRVIAVDLLGYGSSAKPASVDGNYLPTSQARYVFELLADLGVDQYSLLFHDMGGLVAWNMLAKDIKGSSAIQNIVVLNTIISRQGFEHPKMKKGAMARAMANAYSNNLSSAAVLEMTFKNMGLSSNAKLSEGECAGYVLPMKEGSEDALYDFFTSFDDALFADLESNIASLRDYKGGAVVLWGAQDKVLTTKQLPVLQKALPTEAKHIHIFEKNSHFLPEEVPSALTIKLLEFLPSGEL